MVRKNHPGHYKKFSRLGLEQLESRLALTWAGVPPSSISPPASAVLVTLDAANSTGGVATIASTEIDYYRFTATATGTYTISAATPSSNLDTVLGLFAANGKRLAYNDDISGANPDSRVSIKLASGVTYFVGITNFSKATKGAYNWTISGAPALTNPTNDDAFENNDTQGTAADLGTITTTRTVNSLVMADASDWFRFTTTGTGTTANSISLNFQIAQGNLRFALYNSTGTLLAASQPKINGETLTLNGRLKGTYFVRVYGENGATNPNYSLTINAPAIPTVDPTPPPGGFQIELTNLTGLTASQLAVFRAAADRWSEIIVGDVPSFTLNGQVIDDLQIDASSVAIDGVNGILGQAGPDFLRPGSLLPITGTMQFDTADMAALEADGSLYAVILHEMGHVLGIGTLWGLKRFVTATPTGSIYTGPQAVAAYNQIFGTNALGVPIENIGGGGTAGAHWRESIFVSELMTGFAGPGTYLPISRVTVGSLADLGYSVNYAAADAFTRPTALDEESSVGGTSSVASRYAFLRAAETTSQSQLAASNSRVAVNVSTTTNTVASSLRASASLNPTFVDPAMVNEVASANEPGVSRLDRRFDYSISTLNEATDDALEAFATARMTFS